MHVWVHHGEAEFLVYELLGVGINIVKIQLHFSVVHFGNHIPSSLEYFFQGNVFKRNVRVPSFESRDI